MRMSLYVVIRNESNNLADALLVNRELVDEVVVVDRGSGDDARQLALDHGARVYDLARRDDLAAARAESIRRARGQWVLRSRERFTKSNARAIAASGHLGRKFINVAWGVGGKILAKPLAPERLHQFVQSAICAA
jgi:hypothetical protein